MTVKIYLKAEEEIKIESAARSFTDAMSLLS